MIKKRLKKTTGKNSGKKTSKRIEKRDITKIKSERRIKKDARKEKNSK